MAVEKITRFGLSNLDKQVSAFLGEKPTRHCESYIVERDVHGETVLTVRFRAVNLDESDGDPQ